MNLQSFLNKNIFLYIFIILIIVIILIFINCKQSKKINENKFSIKNENISKNYDEETRLYYILDKETNEIISASYNEDDLRIYEDNPDYNPNPLAAKSAEISSFIDYENFENYNEDYNN